MSPGQVHSWKLEPGSDGFIILFDSEFLEFPSNPHIEPKDTGTLDAIVKEMYKEDDEKIRRAWLNVLLLKLATYYDESRTVNATTFRIRKLEQLIDVNFLKLKKPADYANLMNLSPAYLNNLCKKTPGQNVVGSHQRTNCFGRKKVVCLHGPLTWHRCRTSFGFRSRRISCGFSARMQVLAGNSSKKARFVLFNS
ncbi:MAG: hypothetical protein WDO14_16610 [Bacteroidota bacterium]